MADAPPRAGLVYDRRLASLRFSEGHPFRPDRARLFYELCGRYGLLSPDRVQELRPALATEEDLLVHHTPRYVRLLQEGAAQAEQGPPTLEMLEVGLGYPDNPLFPELWEYVRRSTGATLTGLRHLLDGKLRVAFNPVGGFHHAFAERAEGFCYQNDLVIAARRAADAGQRVAVVDIDAHHGNATQEAFWRDPRVLKVSIHQNGETLYPGTGAPAEQGGGPGAGFTLNVPLAPGSDDEILAAAFDAVVPRALDAFGPDLVILQIGADILHDDPLTDLRMTNRGHRHCMAGIATRGLPVLALGGGGYQPTHSVRTWTLAWSALTGIEPVDDFAHLAGPGLFGGGTGELLDAPRVAFDEAKERARRALSRTLTALEPVLAELPGRAAEAAASAAPTSSRP